MTKKCSKLFARQIQSVNKRHQYVKNPPPSAAKHGIGVNSAAKVRLFFDICKKKEKNRSKGSDFSFSAFSCQPSDLAAGVLLIVSISLDLPVPREHGLFAVGFVLLRVERGSVGSQLAEVVLAGLHRRGYLREAGVRPYLVRRLRSRTIVSIRSTEVHARTDFALRRGFTVGTDDVRTAAVTVFGLGFGKTTLYVVNTIKILDLSHSSVFFMG